MALLLAHHFRCSLVDVVKHRKFLDFPLVLSSPAKARSRPGFVRSTPETEGPRATAGEAISSGQGFGQPEKKQQKGAKRVIRRSPVERPAFLDKKDDEVGKEQGQSESAFLLSWLVLGALILIQGILLAASVKVHVLRSTLQLQGAWTCQDQGSGPYLGKVTRKRKYTLRQGRHK